ncbi:MAG: ATP-binding protein [Euzebyales bacterium]|nr:ATP-binding protein [Euzebyales bacterium]
MTAFANTSGGTLVFGVREQDGQAVEVTGVPANGLDAELSRLSNVLHDWTTPRVGPNVDLSVLPLGAGLAVVVVEVDRSWSRPHAVSSPGEHTMSFYRRVGRDSLPFDAVEVAELVRESQSLPSRLHAFHADRVAAIQAGELPRPLLLPRYYVLTVTPWQALRPMPPQVPVVDLQPRLLERAHVYRPSLEGVVVIDTDQFLDDERPAFEQAVAHRSGAVEFVGHVGFYPEEGDSDAVRFSHLNVEESIVAHVGAVARYWFDAGITGPCSLGLTLVGTRDVIAPASTTSGHEHDSRIRRPALRLPRLDLMDAPRADEQSVATALRPMFDVLAKPRGGTARGASTQKGIGISSAAYAEARIQPGLGDQGHDLARRATI